MVNSFGFVLLFPSWAFPNLLQIPMSFTLSETAPLAALVETHSSFRLLQIAAPLSHSTRLSLLTSSFQQQPAAHPCSAPDCDHAMLTSHPLLFGEFEAETQHCTAGLGVGILN